MCVWMPVGREEDGATVYLGSDADPVVYNRGLSCEQATDVNTCGTLINWWLSVKIKPQVWACCQEASLLVGQVSKSWHA